MTVPVQTPIDTATAAGSDTFSYNFLVVDADHMDVYLDDVIQGSGYTVNNVGTPAGGTVVFTSAPANGVVVALRRNVPYARTEFDYQTSGDFQAAEINLDLDTAAMQIQQLKDLSDRSIRISSTDTSTTDLTLPTPAASQYIMINSAGDGLSLVDGSAIDSAMTLNADINFIATSRIKTDFDDQALSVAESYRNIYFDGAATFTASGSTGTDIKFTEFDTSDYGSFNYVVERFDATTGITVTQGTGASSVPLAYPAGIVPGAMEWSGVVRNVAGYLMNMRVLEMTLTLAQDTSPASDGTADRPIVYKITATETTAKIPDGISIVVDNLTSGSFANARAWYAGYSS